MKSVRTQLEALEYRLKQVLHRVMEIEPVNMAEKETTCSLSWTKEKDMGNASIDINWKKIAFYKRVIQ